VHTPTGLEQPWVTRSLVVCAARGMQRSAADTAGAASDNANARAAARRNVRREAVIGARLSRSRPRRHRGAARTAALVDSAAALHEEYPA
jgi:hypothetical protein